MVYGLRPMGILKGMNMIKIAVCDDEPYIRSYLVSLIRKQKQEQEIQITEYVSAGALLHEWKAYDLLFLDIELGESDIDSSTGELNGMELARQIRASDGTQPLIIFVTGHEAHVYDAFDVDAFQYLLKPLDEDRFARVFRRAAERILLERQQKKLVFQYAGASRILPVDSILYIESQGHKIVLHLKDSTLEYYAKLGDLEQELQGQFCRIHRGILVNLAYVEEYSKTTVTLTNGRHLNLSKYKYDGFVKAHLQFLRTFS